MNGWRRLPLVVAPTALALLHAAKADVRSGVAPSLTSTSSGPAVGGLIIGREDLLRVRASMGRISDELQLILGVLDQHFESSAAAASAAGRNGGVARGSGDGVAAAEGYPDMELPLPRAAPEAKDELSPTVAAYHVWAPWLWGAASWLTSVGIFALDIGIVVGMQLFLESIGRKKATSMIMPKKGLENAIATRTAGGAPAPPGAPIPAPSATPRPTSTQRFSVLLEEEFLAAALSEHWVKLAVGAGLALFFRLPQQLLHSEGLTCSMFTNLGVMLRCMSLVMLVIRDDMTLPKKEKGHSAAGTGNFVIGGSSVVASGGHSTRAGGGKPCKDAVS